MSAQQQLEEIEELARRAIACKRWRWMPGMQYQAGGTVGRLSDSQCKGKLPLVAETMPNLSDPATLGCLLALVREAWGPAASVSVNMSGFWAVGSATVLSGKGKGASINLGIWKVTELEALVAALEVAP